MVDRVALEQKLELDKVFAAGKFFVDADKQYVKARFSANPTDNPLPVLTDRVNNQVFSFSGYLDLGELPPQVYQQQFESMVVSLKSPQAYSGIKGSPLRHLGEILEALDAKFDTAFPLGDPLRARAEEHRGVLKGLWAKLHDQALLADVHAILAPNMPPPKPGGMTP